MKCLLVLFAVSVSVLPPGTCTEMCGRPGSPRNGTLLYENDFDVTYTCDEGFAILDGDKARHCENGTWNGNVLRCAEKRQVDGISPDTPDFCYDFALYNPIKFSFNHSTIYSVSWDTNLKNWNESMKIWPFQINVVSVETNSTYSVQGNKIKHFNIQDKNMVQVTLHERIANVSELTIFSDATSNVICGVKIFAIETDENCEEPDSPVHGQYVWNRNDSVATFQCDDNFNLTSNVSLNCVDGKWNGTQPKCIAQTQEGQSIGPGDANNLTTISVPVTNENQNLTETTSAPMVQSGEFGNLPVSIGVPAAALLIFVISAIIHKKKLCSKNAATGSYKVEVART